MKSSYTILLLIMLVPILKGRGLIKTCDSRVIPKSIKWDMQLYNNMGTLKSKLTHYKWQELIYSDKLCAKDKQIYSVIVGGSPTNIKDIKKILPDNIVDKYFSVLRKKMSFKSKKNFGKQVIINCTKRKCFYIYFQEILKLEIIKVSSENNLKKSFSFILGTNNISTVTMTLNKNDD